MLDDEARAEMIERHWTTPGMAKDMGRDLEKVTLGDFLENRPDLLEYFEDPDTTNYRVESGKKSRVISDGKIHIVLKRDGEKWILWGVSKIKGDVLLPNP